MPNAHAADKEVLGFYIPRTLATRVRKAAKARGITITAFIEEVLTHGTTHIELTPEDYEAIAEATRRALYGQAQKRTGRKNQKGGAS
jgi:predicted DNA-binding protein